jgi:HPt (histidine-containing phosphotransfer) domain-containing protein
MATLHMTNNEPAVWTPERLAQFGLLSDGGEAAVAVVQAFNDTMATDVHDVLHAADAARWNEVCRLAHRIAGSCLNLGADRLGHHCRAIESSLLAAPELHAGGVQPPRALQDQHSRQELQHPQPHALTALLAELPSLAERTQAATQAWLLTL